jgi:hypothetical protein
MMRWDDGWDAETRAPRLHVRAGGRAGCWAAWAVGRRTTWDDGWDAETRAHRLHVRAMMIKNTRSCARLDFDARGCGGS